MAEGINSQPKHVTVEKKAMEDMDNIIELLKIVAPKIKSSLKWSNMDDFSKLLKTSHSQNVEGALLSMGKLNTDIMDILHSDTLDKKGFLTLNKKVSAFLQNLVEYGNSSKTISEDFKEKGVDLDGTQGIIDEVTEVMMQFIENIGNKLLQNWITVENQEELDFIKNLWLRGASKVKIWDTAYLQNNTIVVWQPQPTNNQMDIFDFLVERKWKLVDGEIVD